MLKVSSKFIFPVGYNAKGTVSKETSFFIENKITDEIRY